MTVQSRLSMLPSNCDVAFQRIAFVHSTHEMIGKDNHVLFCRQLSVQFSPLLYLYGHAGSGFADRHQQASSSSSPFPEVRFPTLSPLLFRPQIPCLILPPWHTPTRLWGWGWVSHQPPAEPQEKHRRSRTVATSSVARLE